MKGKRAATWPLILTRGEFPYWCSQRRLRKQAEVEAQGNAWFADTSKVERLQTPADPLVADGVIVTGSVKIKCELIKNMQGLQEPWTVALERRC